VLILRKRSISPVFHGRVFPSPTPTFQTRNVGHPAVYQVKENAVEISRIYHGAQDWA